MIQILFASFLAGLALGFVMKAGGVPLFNTPWMIIAYLGGFGLFNILRWIL